jgi:hypothetical protein
VHSWKCSQITEGRFRRLDRLGHRRFGPGRQAQGRRQRGAELQEFAPRHFQSLLDLFQRLAAGIENLVHLAHVCSPSGSQAASGPGNGGVMQVAHQLRAFFNAPKIQVPCNDLIST